MKFFVVFLSTFLAFHVHAEYLTYSKSDDAQHYYEPETIKRENGNVRVWILMDFKKVQPDGGNSYRLLEEVDCKERRIRRLQMTVFKGAIGTGDTLAQNDAQGEWSFIPPATVFDYLKNKVCN